MSHKPKDATMTEKEHNPIRTQPTLTGPPDKRQKTQQTGVETDKSVISLVEEMKAAVQGKEDAEDPDKNMAADDSIIPPSTVTTIVLEPSDLAVQAHMAKHNT